MLFIFNNKNQWSWIIVYYYNIIVNITHVDWICFAYNTYVNSLIYVHGRCVYFYSENVYVFNFEVVRLISRLLSRSAVDMSTDAIFVQCNFAKFHSITYVNWGWTNFEWHPDQIISKFCSLRYSYLQPPSHRLNWPKFLPFLSIRSSHVSSLPSFFSVCWQ